MDVHRPEADDQIVDGEPVVRREQTRQFGRGSAKRAWISILLSDELRIFDPDADRSANACRLSFLCGQRSVQRVKAATQTLSGQPVPGGVPSIRLSCSDP